MFDEWRLYKDLSIEKSIGDLSEEEDLHPFVDMLLKFSYKLERWMAICTLIICKYRMSLF